MRLFLGAIHVLFSGVLVSTVIANNVTCKNPKVRREWRKLSTDQRIEWINAIKCLTTLPHDPRLTPSVPANVSLIPPINETSSFYDDISYLHMDLNPKIHFTGMFLPWHRYYVQWFENVLTNKCGYKGVQPYWDWTQDAPDFYNSKFFDNSSSGVGGWGDPANDYQISTGAFKDLMFAYPTPHRIRRNYTLYPFDDPNFVLPFPLPKHLMVNTTITKENVDHVVNNYEGDYFGFQAYFESATGTHAGLHLIVGGDMTGTCPNGTGPPDCYPGAKWPPNDPLFFLHHAMVDKIWYDWQNKSPKNKYAYGGGSVEANLTAFVEFPTGLPPYYGFDSEIPGDGLWDGIQVWDMMDTTGDTLCYVYA